MVKKKTHIRCGLSRDDGLRRHAERALYGIGLGFILPVTLNLVLSLVSAKDTPETAGLNGTFEQLGHAVGVALVGTIMVVSLSFTLEQGISASQTLTTEEQAAVVSAIDEGVQLVSNAQLAEGLEAAGASQEDVKEVVLIYEDARVDTFRSGLALLLFMALAGLVLTLGLPNRMLVEAEEVDTPDVEAAA